MGPATDKHQAPTHRLKLYPKMYPHTKFGIPTANNIGYVPHQGQSDPNQYRTLWHPNMYPQSKFGIPSLKQYKIYALDTIFLEPGSEDKVKITAQELEVRSLNHPYSLKTKSSQCHYVVMTRSETKFQAPLNRRYQKVLEKTE